MRGLAAFVMRGPAQAGLIASTTLVLSLLVPPSIWLGGAAVGLYALRRGPAAGMLVAAIALASTSALLWLALGKPLIGALLALSLWVPVLSVAIMLRITVRLDWSLLAAGGFGLLLVLLLFAVMGDPVAVWRDGLMAALPADRVQREFGLDPAKFDAQAWQQLLARIAALMTGFMGAAVALNTVLSLLLARWWQAQLFNPGGFGGEFRALRLGQVAAALALALLAGAWLSGSQLLMNCAVVVTVVYLFQGLAIVHGMVKQRGMGWGVPAGFYVLMFFAMAQVTLALALLGIIDAWLDVRRRWPGKSTPPSD